MKVLFHSSIHGSCPSFREFMVLQAIKDQKEGFLSLRSSYPGYTLSFSSYFAHPWKSCKCLFSDRICESEKMKVLAAQLCPILCNLIDCWFLCPWDSAGKNTGVGCLSLLKRIFLTHGSNQGLPHCRQTLYCLSHLGSLFLAFSRLTFYLQSIYQHLHQRRSDRIRLLSW